MQTITLYGIKTCGSVQKARRFLDSRAVVYRFVDWKSTPLDSSELEYFVQAVGVDVLLNTKGATYKKLGLKEQNLDEQGKKRAMLANPLLIKRPVIVIEHSGAQAGCATKGSCTEQKAENQVLVGFDEKRLAEVFG